MAVTELAVLNIINTTENLPKTYSVLAKALDYLSKASGLPFRIYCSHISERRLYLIGHWDSIEHHSEFLTSPENQELLKDVDGLLEVESMFHIGIDRSELPLDAERIGVKRFTAASGYEHELLRQEGVGGWRLDGLKDGDIKERYHFHDVTENGGLGWEELKTGAITDLLEDCESDIRSKGEAV